MLKPFLKGLGVLSGSLLFLISSLVLYTAIQEQETVEFTNTESTLPLSNNANEEVLQNYDTFLQSVRTPRGFADVLAVNKFALEKGILVNTDKMLEPITIGELAQLLVNMDKYYQLPEGFGDKVKEEDADLTKVADTTIYTEYLREALSRGWLTVEQVQEPTDTISLNDFTRITYNTALNILPYTAPTEEEIDIALAEIGSVTKEDRECRIAKVTFLYYYDLIPFTYKGDFPLGRLVTKQDAINMLITYTDVIDIQRADSKNPNVGCAPCVDTALALEREKYSNEK